MLDIFAFDQKLPKDTTLNPSVTAEALGKCQTGYHSSNTYLCNTPTT